MSKEWLVGEFRTPRQMLGDQEYDGHLSIHDDQMAEDLGFAGAPIEGPTHFSQFVPLLHEVFGDDWFVCVFLVICSRKCLCKYIKIIEEEKK